MTTKGQPGHNDPAAIERSGGGEEGGSGDRSGSAGNDGRTISYHTNQSTAKFEFRTFKKRGIHIWLRSVCPGRGGHAR
jgi:hypothetical protein